MVCEHDAGRLACHDPSWYLLSRRFWLRKRHAVPSVYVLLLFFENTDHRQLVTNVDFITMNLYPNIIHKGDLSPEACGPKISTICEEIHHACKGWGTDEDRLLKAMGSQTPEMRCQVYLQYKVWAEAVACIYCIV